MRIKHVLLAFVALIVAALVGGYIYLSTLDFETLKAQLQDEVEKATGRQLSIDGPLDLAIGLQPAVAVDQVALSNADWGSRPQMVTLERFELELDLLSLLTGDVQVNRIVLVRPDILLETDPAGEGNWVMAAAGASEDAAAGDTAPVDTAPVDTAPAEPAEPAVSGDGPLIPNIVAVEIEEGQFVYRDGVTGETTTLGLDSLVLTQGLSVRRLR